MTVFYRIVKPYAQALVISASLDRTVMVWEVAIQGGTAKLLHKLEGHSHGVDCVALSPDQRHVASASRDKTVRIWDLMAGQQVAVLEGHSERVTSVAWPWSDGGVCLVSGSYDKTVRVWAPDWQPVRMFEGCFLLLGVSVCLIVYVLQTYMLLCSKQCK